LTRRECLSGFAVASTSLSGTASQNGQPHCFSPACLLPPPQTSLLLVFSPTSPRRFFRAATASVIMSATRRVVLTALLLSFGSALVIRQQEAQIPLNQQSIPSYNDYITTTAPTPHLDITTNETKGWIDPQLNGGRMIDVSDLYI
jgi:hypothetical protein